MSVSEKAAAHGPKKILTLDGGGIRAILSVEILARIENLLRNRFGNSFVLADYFDFIAGTSTGGLIAACLSWGMSVDQIRNIFLAFGKEMFDKASLFNRFHRYKFNSEKWSKRLQQIFSDATLGSENLKTLLMIVVRNYTMDSPFTVSNIPMSKYNDRSRADSNLKIPLWQLVRASMAAPTYFAPEVIKIADKEYIFVDGGLTMYNNPSFQTFLMATLEPYKLNWPAGEERIFLVSVGTGSSPDANLDLKPEDINLLYNASKIPSALMHDALNQQDYLCRAFGKCVVGDPLDREVGDMIGAVGPVNPKLFTYARYTAELTYAGLADLGLEDIEPQNVQQLDSIEFIPDLQRVGRSVAERKVKLEHFMDFLR